MATSTLQRERLEQRFALWDADHDGLVERTDYEAEARRILSAFGESEATPQGGAVVETYRRMFDFAAHELGIPDGGGMTPEQFNDISTRYLLEQGDAGFSKILKPCIQAVANLADEDGDGMVDRGEFAQWIRAIGSPANPEELFDQLDTNGSGMLSVEEVIQAVRDYHAGRLETPLLGR